VRSDRDSQRRSSGDCFEVALTDIDSTSYETFTYCTVHTSVEPRSAGTARIIYCDIRGGYRERLRYGKSTPNYVPQYLHTERSDSLISVLGIWIDAFDHGAMLSIHYRRKLRKWRIANAKSRVDVGDRL